jgi:processive 1,2-diacylglycerol beta-glucosyltransferase
LAGRCTEELPPVKKIAVLTLSVGAGHVRAAQVIERALMDGEEPVQARMLDALDLAQVWFTKLYVQPYWWMLRHAPVLWRRLFERRQRNRHSATAPTWVFRHGCAGVLRELKEFDPHLVIATEVGAAEMAALGKRDGRFSAPILAVQTDFQSEPPWVQREIDFHCVGSDEAKSELIGWGVSPNRVLACGIPIDPAFAFSYERAELLKALGLREEDPVVLVMGGGMGPAPLDQIIRRLELCGTTLQVLAVTGHDTVMKARVESLRGKVALDLRVFGWTDNIPELMAVADVLVTKPGGLTTSEALAMNLPMVLTHPIPGPEERHLRYLERHGVALGARQLEEIPSLVNRILISPGERDEMVRRARELARPDAADAVALVARALLEEATYIDLLASPPVRAVDSVYLM